MGISMLFVQKKEGKGLNKFTYEGDNRVVIERFLLFIYTIYAAVMITLCAKQEGGTDCSLIMLAGISICWIVHMAKNIAYPFRALVDALVMQGIIFLYSGYAESVSKVLPIFMVEIVLLGMYGIERLLYTATVTTVLLYLYHGLVLQTFSLVEAQERIDIALQLVNVFFLS